MGGMTTPSTTLQLERLLAGAFHAAGFELFVVGGAVRDQLLGIDINELDFATDARPADTGRILDVISGIAVYRIGEKFGTIGAICGEARAEITTYRSGERYLDGSRKPEVQFGHTLAEDLARRDFTINAIARPALGSPAGPDGGHEVTAPKVAIAAAPVALPAVGTANTLVDPFGGATDLRAGIVRTVASPEERFDEDPLRLLRGVRFAAALDFEIESETWAAMQRSASLLERISRERISDEMTKMLTGANPARAFSLLRDTGLLAAVPELLALDAMPDHGPRHPLSLWDHTMAVVSGVRSDPVSRWAALLHDIAKPETRTFDTTGRIRFPNHDQVGAQISRRVMESLRMSGEMIASVYDLIDTHMQLHQYSPEWSDGAVRRLYVRLGPNFGRALDLARADARGHGETSWGISKVEALAERARLLSEAVPEITSPLNGRELVERYGKQPGPWVGRIKNALTEKVLEGDLAVDDKPRAWRLADEIAESLWV
jgi:poly(A) polymerase